MLRLFGGNPLITALIGMTLLVIGLAGHSPLMPWIGGALIVVGGLKTMAGRGRR
jgi:hypothetical protein